MLRDRLNADTIHLYQEIPDPLMSQALENLNTALETSIAAHGLQQTIQLVVRVSEDTCEDWSKVSADVSLLTSIMSLIDHYNKTRLGIPNDVSEQLFDLVRSRHQKKPSQPNIQHENS